MKNAILAEPRDYEVFGLRLRSDFALPELFQAEGHAEPDVRIAEGPVQSPPVGTAGLHAHDGALVLVVPGIGRYRIEGGAAITVEPDSDVPGRNVRLFLLGSALGALLHQRRLLPIHANAVEIDGRAVAFMAASGGGKSTLAAWFHDQGFRVIADDVCVVGFGDDGQPYATPGLPRLRLWAETLELMGRDPVSYPRSYAGPDQVDKFDVQIDPRAAVQSHTPLAAIYLLERGEPEIRRLSGVEAADAIFANTYRGAYLAATNGHEQHWSSSVRLVRNTPVFRASRTWSLNELDGQCAMLLQHARSISVPGQSARVDGS